MNEKYGKTDIDNNEMNEFLDKMILQFYKDELEADVAATVAEKWL